MIISGGITNGINVANSKIRILNYVSNTIISEKISIDEWSKGICAIVWKNFDSSGSYYNELKIFIKVHKKLPIGRDVNTEEGKLARWCQYRRCEKRQGLLTDEKINLLQKLDYWYWDKIDSFNNNYPKLIKFIEDNDRLPITSSKEINENV